MSEPTTRNVTVFRVTGMLSMLATSYMMCEILTSKKKRKRTYSRLMFGISLIEFTDGLAFFLGPWASGNDASCQFQGFLLQVSIGSSIYNAVLALYYLLSIRYNWSERRIKKNVEPWMHGISLSFAYGTGIACIPLGLFTSLGTVCYIGKTPYGCQESYMFGDEANCTQGDNATLYTIFFFTIWQWISITFTAAAMIMIWLGVREQENKMARYSFEFGDEPTRKNSRRFMKQGLFYVLVFYFCHLPSTTHLAMINAGNFNAYYTWELVVALTYPLEGFLNFLVYMRPRINKYLKKRKIQKFKAAAREAAEREAASRETHPSADTVENPTIAEKEENDGNERQSSRHSSLVQEILLDEQEQDELCEY